MKKHLLFCLLLAATVTASAQEKFAPVQQAELTRLINNIRTTVTQSDDNLAVRCVLVAGKHRAGTESDEVKDDLYVGVSETGEAPVQKLFVLRDVYAVRNIRLASEKTGFLLSFSCVDLKSGKTKNGTYRVSLVGIVSKK